MIRCLNKSDIVTWTSNYVDEQEMCDKSDADNHKDTDTKVRIIRLKRYWWLVWTELP